jgi:hypothetical protein
MPVTYLEIQDLLQSFQNIVKIVAVQFNDNAVSGYQYTAFGDDVTTSIFNPLAYQNWGISRTRTTTTTPPIASTPIGNSQASAVTIQNIFFNEYDRLYYGFVGSASYIPLATGSSSSINIRDAIRKSINNPDSSTGDFITLTGKFLTLFTNRGSRGQAASWIYLYPYNYV